MVLELIKITTIIMSTNEKSPKQKVSKDFLVTRVDVPSLLEREKQKTLALGKRLSREAVHESEPW